MRTSRVGLRVADRERSLAFCTAVGCEVVGDVPQTGPGHPTMLELPGDEFVPIELVHDPERPAQDRETGLGHVVITVESMDATVAELAAHASTPRRPRRRMATATS